MKVKKKLSRIGLINRTILGGLAFLGILFSGIALADSVVTLQQISGNIDSSVSQLATIMTDVSLIAGIGFIMASFFKFHQHRLNPTQVPMSQGISLLLVGTGLTLVTLLIPTSQTAIFGSGAKTTQVGGSDINTLIGGS